MRDATDLLGGLGGLGGGAVAVAAAAVDVAGGEVATLRHDVQCVLLEYTRDRPAPGLARLTAAQAAELAAGLAPLLAGRIGGRYVPKGMFRSGWEERRARDEAVWAMFKGRNHEEVMRRFGISRRLLYSILSRRRRG